MKQTVRHGLGIALSAMAFLCNYSPWVREAASLPDALTLTSGQKFVVQTGLPMLAASDGGAVSVLASQDERVTISAEAGGQTSVTFSLLGLIPVHETRVNVVEERTLIPGGQAVGVALKTRGVLVVSDAAKGRALRAGDVILSADGKNVESTKALSEQVGTAQTDTVRLEVLRGGQTITVDAQAEPDPSDGRRKLGVWVRDSTAGVGTLTYIDPANHAYGALGHAIVDADTGRLLAAREGAILHASIVGVTKGQSGKAGELKGNFLKAGEQIGSLMENCEYGIYGVLDDMPENLLYPPGASGGRAERCTHGRGQHYCHRGHRRPTGIWRGDCALLRAERAEPEGHDSARDGRTSAGKDGRHCAGHERKPHFTGWTDYRRGDARLSERRDTGIWHVYRVDARKKRRDGRVGTGRVNTTERRGCG